MDFSKKIIQHSLFYILILISLVLLIGGSLSLIPSLQYHYFNAQIKNTNPTELSIEEGVKSASLQKEVSNLEKSIEKLIPFGSYLIINTSNNTFKLFKNKKNTREGICSTGSYIELEGANEKKWIFETPKGVFKVQGKLVNPVWKKPDWAFAEEGLPIPPPDHHSRFEYGVLGDYALSIGNGYLIHGTLYQRFLGLPVTHGCVRLNDSDLEYIYNNMPVGAKVYIY